MDWIWSGPALAALSAVALVVSLGVLVRRAEPQAVAAAADPCATLRQECERLRGERDVLLQLLRQYAPPPTLEEVASALARPLHSRRMVAVLPTVDGAESTALEAHRAALQQSGGPWELVMLLKEHATRADIVRELHAGGGARLLMFIGHGGAAQLELPQGEMLSRQWLAQVVRRFGVEALVLIACDSDDLAHAAISAGARVVIAFSGKVGVVRSGQLLALFLQALARGETVRHAAELGSMAADDATDDMIRVRGDSEWRWTYDA